MAQRICFSHFNGQSTSSSLLDQLKFTTCEDSKFVMKVVGFAFKWEIYTHRTWWIWSSSVIANDYKKQKINYSLLS